MSTFSGGMGMQAQLEQAKENGSVKMYVVCPRATTKKITKKYILWKSLKELKYYSRNIHLMQKKAVKEEQNQIKKDMRHIENES